MRAPNVVAEDDAESGATRVSVFTPDREGLFYRICAGLAAAGANIIDARIHTTRDGMALDNLLVLDGRGQAYCDRRLRGRLVEVGRRGADRRRAAATAARPSPRSRAARSSRSFGGDRGPRVDAGRRWSRSTRATGPALLAGLAARDPRGGPPASIPRISRPTASAR